ncbi:MAG: amidohydrolase [Planctomycetota bacterium]
MMTRTIYRIPACIVTVLMFSISLAGTKELSAQQAADLVLVGGRVITMDDGRPEGEAIAIQGTRVLAVGSVEYIRGFIGSDTEVVDVEGNFVMPGFIEGHAHYIGLGQSKMMLDLMPAGSWEEIVHQVQEATEVTPPGEWILGRGWHQSKWDTPPEGNVEGYPIHDAISAISPDHPVLLTHASGHMNFANEYAMRLAGIDGLNDDGVSEQTPEPEGGEILRNEDGSATGVFRETAQRLITRRLAADEASRSAAEQADYMRRAIQLAGEECLRNGITSFQDAGTTVEYVKILREFAARGELPVRLWVMIRDNNELMRGRLGSLKMIDFGDQFLTVRALKRSIDGALGPHGAWLLSPYEDLPNSSGLNTASVESVTETAQLAIENDFQMCVHAIGDRANREVLDIYERLFNENPSILPRRWRIEHAQHLHPEDIPRFAQLSVIASMQGVHCTSDAVFVPTRLGMRRSKEGAYVWQSLIQSGAVVTNGTDAPVESIDPIASFYASVTRELGDGVTFFPEEAMTREQALRSYTIDCAYAAFEESQKGSLVPGKLADIVVLSNDLLECSDDEIRDTKVEMTIVGGEIRYIRPDEESPDKE